jgi:hypothetical protein
MEGRPRLFPNTRTDTMNKNTIRRNLTPTVAQVDQATTVRKLAARLNALVIEMDNAAWAGRPSNADLPMMVQVEQEKTATGRYREEAFVPVRGIGCGAVGFHIDGEYSTTTVLRTVNA